MPNQVACLTMIEVVGAAIGVAGVTARSTHRLWKLCEAWREAPREVFPLLDGLQRAQEFYTCLKVDVTNALAVPLATSKSNPPGPPTWNFPSSDVADPLERPPPPWSPPGTVATKGPPSGPVAAIFGLIKAAGGILGELETVIEHVLAGQAAGCQRAPGNLPSTQPINARRRVT